MVVPVGFGRRAPSRPEHREDADRRAVAFEAPELPFRRSAGRDVTNSSGGRGRDQGARRTPAWRRETVDERWLGVA